MKYLVLCFLMLFAAGCHTTNIQTTKTWEGHFKDIESFKTTTDNITLEKNESIWVLSDRTLNRVLKNTQEK